MTPPARRTWIERRTADGSFTLEHGLHGETYHSLSGAWTQARERYARGCRLRERALEIAAVATGAEERVLRLLDVGTGLGLNLAAALEALDGTGVALEATSLERDAELLTHAASAPREPADLERWHSVVRAAMTTALANGAPAEFKHLGGRLHLLVGDAPASLSGLDGGRMFDASFEASFDAVFLDPFSPRVEPDLWSRPFLSQVAARMAPGSLLATYSAATEVRVGLLAAGLRVGAGARVGRKREGTLASPDRALPAFDPRVERRLAARLQASRGAAGFATRAEDTRRSMP